MPGLGAHPRFLAEVDQAAERGRASELLADSPHDRVERKTEETPDNVLVLALQGQVARV